MLNELLSDDDSEFELEIHDNIDDSFVDEELLEEDLSFDESTQKKPRVTERVQSLTSRVFGDALSNYQNNKSSKRRKKRNDIQIDYDNYTADWISVKKKKIDSDYEFNQNLSNTIPESPPLTPKKILNSIKKRKIEVGVHKKSEDIIDLEQSSDDEITLDLEERSSKPKLSRLKKQKVKPQKQVAERSIIEINDEESENKKDYTFGDILQQCEAISTKLSIQLKLSDIDENKVFMKNQTSNTLINQPDGLKKSLKDYQIIGLNWLYFLHKENINGILADEMGLGKTIQTIALLQHLHNIRDKGPHLIVVPSSTLRNWEREINSWSENLKCLLYYGKQKEREEIQYSIIDQRKEYQKKNCDSEYQFDIMVTTYQICLGKSDRIFLRSIKFNYLILDEAQSIKNKDSQRYQSLFKLQPKHRLLLTGTPLQNNLDELLSLLHFLMPTLFSDIRHLRITKEIKKLRKHNLIHKEKEYVEKMKKILSPFILRRLKSQVGVQMKSKCEKIIKCNMTKFQRKIYDSVYSQSKEYLSDQNDNDSMRNVNQYLNNILMQLRKVSNHPILIRSFYDNNVIKDIANKLLVNDEDYGEERLEDIIDDLSRSSDLDIHEIVSHRSYLKHYKLKEDQLFNSSGKLLTLKSLLPKLKQNGHRVIIFSQMTRVLDILESFLKHIHLGYVRLDGSTPVDDRQEIIDQFSEHNDRYFVFLLSTLAGGVGINLISANVVIFYDISFNPHVDRQAEDRCHRIGQSKDVTIYKLITNNSVEEHMLSMAEEKKELNDMILNEGKYQKKFVNEEFGDKESEEEKRELIKNYLLKT